jgi:hypothetical protein
MELGSKPPEQLRESLRISLPYLTRKLGIRHEKVSLFR